MKKNKMMRTASGLMIATLLTTGVISGTFAKYTTTDSAKDTARVAKWGVTALASGSLYGQNYSSANVGDNEINVDVKGSVDSNHNDNIVAPGTKNSEGLKLQISGQPEVANTVELKKNQENFNEIFLKAGTYATLVKTSNITADNFEAQKPLFTVSADGETYEAAKGYAPQTDYYEVHDITNVTATANGNYYPITYKVEGSLQGEYTDLDLMFADIAKEFNKSYTANKPLTTNANITWEWKYEGQQDEADTILGDLIAKKKETTDTKDYYVVSYTAATNDTLASASKLEEGTDYCLDTDFDITLTVTQQD